MKIEYTIIDPIENEYPTSLKFRILIDSKDWLLINQFKPEKFRYFFNVNPSDYVNLKSTALNPDGTESNYPEFPLVCMWGIGKLEEDIFEKGEDIWYSNEYILESNILKGIQFKKRIESIAKGIQEIMKSAVTETSEGFYSCWKQTKSINYRDEATFMEII